MLNKVIDTYECLISCREKLPGTQLEDVFTPETIDDLKNELEFLKEFKKDKYCELDVTSGNESSYTQCGINTSYHGSYDKFCGNCGKEVLIKDRKI